MQQFTAQTPICMLNTSKVMECSSFGTLEALGASLIHMIVKGVWPLPGQIYAGPPDWQVRVSLEKPTAIPLADGASVEIRSSTGFPKPST
jgi:dihydroneopterin aldolase